MPRGTLWAIYAILQFINRIIVTLHFFCRSKLFYFSTFYQFWLQIVNQKGRYSGGRNHQKLPISNRGAGGAPKPPRLWKTNPRVCPTRIRKNCSFYNLLSTLKVLVGHLLPFLIFCEKTKFLPKNNQNAKKHENRRNDVILTWWGYAKIQLLKISIFNFWDEWGRFWRYIGKKPIIDKTLLMNFWIL